MTKEDKKFMSIKDGLVKHRNTWMDRLTSSTIDLEWAATMREVQPNYEIMVAGPGGMPQKMHIEGFLGQCQDNIRGALERLQKIDILLAQEEKGELQDRYENNIKLFQPLKKIITSENKGVIVNK